MRHEVVAPSGAVYEIDIPDTTFADVSSSIEQRIADRPSDISALLQVERSPHPGQNLLHLLGQDLRQHPILNALSAATTLTPRPISGALFEAGMGIASNPLLEFQQEGVPGFRRFPSETLQTLRGRRPSSFRDVFAGAKVPPALRTTGADRSLGAVSDVLSSEIGQTLGELGVLSAGGVPKSRVGESVMERTLRSATAPVVSIGKAISAPTSGLLNLTQRGLTRLAARGQRTAESLAENRALEPSEFERTTVEVQNDLQHARRAISEKFNPLYEQVTHGLKGQADGNQLGQALNELLVKVGVFSKDVIRLTDGSESTSFTRLRDAASPIERLLLKLHDELRSGESLDIFGSADLSLVREAQVMLGKAVRQIPRKSVGSRDWSMGTEAIHQIGQFLEPYAPSLRNVNAQYGRAIQDFREADSLFDSFGGTVGKATRALAHSHRLRESPDVRDKLLTAERITGRRFLASMSTEASKESARRNLIAPFAAATVGGMIGLPFMGFKGAAAGGLGGFFIGRRLAQEGSGVGAEALTELKRALTSQVGPLLAPLLATRLRQQTPENSDDPILDTLHLLDALK